MYKEISFTESYESRTRELVINNDNMLEEPFKKLVNQETFDLSKTPTN